MAETNAGRRLRRIPSVTGASPGALVPVTLRYEAPDTAEGDARQPGRWCWRGGAAPERLAAPRRCLSALTGGRGPDVLLWDDGRFTVEWAQGPAPVLLRRGRARPWTAGTGRRGRVIDRLWPDEQLLLWVGAGWRVG